METKESEENCGIIWLEG